MFSLCSSIVFFFITWEIFFKPNIDTFLLQALWILYRLWIYFNMHILLLLLCNSNLQWHIFVFMFVSRKLTELKTSLHIHMCRFKMRVKFLCVVYIYLSVSKGLLVDLFELSRLFFDQVSESVFNRTYSHFLIVCIAFIYVPSNRYSFDCRM